MANSAQSQDQVHDNSVVTMDYTLEVDGEVVDSSHASEPIQFIQGQGQIIPGLEQELYGMRSGESKTLVIEPGLGYGEVDQEAFADIPREEFPSDIPLEKGITLQLRDQQGDVLDAFITDVKDDTVRLSFNHPLAGKTLNFQVTVLEVRDATQEELAHGHVHAEGLEWDEDEEDEGWEEDDDEDEG
jgi:FKBP-type peptidyl-prolyl cis-trans isomerase SlyD